MEKRFHLLPSDDNQVLFKKRIFYWRRIFLPLIDNWENQWAPLPICRSLFKEVKVSGYVLPEVEVQNAGPQAQSEIDLLS